jgi:hypothetical protein
LNMLWFSRVRDFWWFKISFSKATELALWRREDW